MVDMVVFLPAVILKDEVFSKQPSFCHLLPKEGAFKVMNFHPVLCCSHHEPATGKGKKTGYLITMKKSGDWLIEIYMVDLFLTQYWLIFKMHFQYHLHHKTIHGKLLLELECFSRFYWISSERFIWILRLADGSHHSFSLVK